MGQGDCGGQHQAKVGDPSRCSISTKPRGTNPGYGYLIQLVAARSRASKKRTHRASLGTTANWTFCKLRGLLIGDSVGSKPQHRTTWARAWCRTGLLVGHLRDHCSTR